MCVCHGVCVCVCVCVCKYIYTYIYIYSFRGTSSAQDAKTDAKYHKLRGFQELCPLAVGWKKSLSEDTINKCAFHRGFYEQYSAVASAVREELEKGAAALGEEYKLVVCGHSMGGALANLSHFDLLASAFAQPEKMQLVTIGSGPVGNTFFAHLHDELAKVHADARRHLHIVNNNDPVPAAALGIDDGGSLCCMVAFRDGETFEHSGTLIWMGRLPGMFRTRSINFLSGLLLCGRRICSPITACCLTGNQTSVFDHMTEPYVQKMAQFMVQSHGTSMRCLGSDSTVASGGTVRARVWTGVGSPGFIFPELRSAEADGLKALQILQAKPNFAICLSGGGFRATTCALGWVRILRREGILQQARFMTSNSGGSWFNTAFSYQKVCDPETFLGEYLEPSVLTPSAAEKQGKAENGYAKAIADSSFMKDFLSQLVSDWFSFDFFKERDTNRVRAWSLAVG